MVSVIIDKELNREGAVCRKGAEIQSYGLETGAELNHHEQIHTQSQEKEYLLHYL